MYTQTQQTALDILTFLGSVNKDGDHITYLSKFNRNSRFDLEQGFYTAKDSLEVFGSEILRTEITIKNGEIIGFAGFFDGYAEEVGLLEHRFDETLEAIKSKIFQDYKNACLYDFQAKLEKALEA